MEVLPTRSSSLQATSRIALPASRTGSGVPTSKKFLQVGANKLSQQPWQAASAQSGQGLPHSSTQASTSTKTNGHTATPSLQQDTVPMSMGKQSTGFSPTPSREPPDSPSSLNPRGVTRTFVSSRSADVILSEVRPTHIKPEALRALNDFLDELLWLVLSAARSFATPKLKAGLIKVLPTNLGKDCVLEAEVELRAYWERNPPSVPPSASIDDSFRPSEFPLHPAYELLRYKCEAYCTLGLQEENFDVETRLQQDLVDYAGAHPPKLSLVAPAALYLTAILEHVSEHILGQLGRVVTRDSSRTTAHVHDLYTALCEDESIYPLFRTMRVLDPIQAQSQIARPRRSKSFTDHNRRKSITKPDDAGIPSRTSTTSPQPTSDPPPIALTSSLSTRPRPPPESLLSSLPPRSASSTGIRSLSAKSALGLGGHKKAESAHITSLGGLSGKNTPEDFSDGYDEAANARDFDDLMRSGTTMKVSLTPDRLKTFEVFEKEKTKRARTLLSKSTSDVKSPTSPSGSELSPRLARTSSARGPLVARDVIDEDDEDDISLDTHGSAQNRRPGNKPRTRTQSLADFLSEPPPWETHLSKPVPVPSKLNKTRGRSNTDNKAPKADQMQTGRYGSPVLRRRSSTGQDVVDAVQSQADKLQQIQQSRSTIPEISENEATNPTSTAAASDANGRPESLDLAKVLSEYTMNHQEPSAHVNGHRRTRADTGPKFRPKSPQQAGSGTKDLIDFLRSDAPFDNAPAPPLAQSMRSESPAKPGRFRSMVSRLTRKGSGDRLARSESQTSSVGSVISKPPPGSFAGRLPPMRPKRSDPDIHKNSLALPRASAAGLSSSESSPPQTSTGFLARKASHARKGVPAFESSNGAHTTPPAPLQDIPSSDRVIPLPLRSAPASSSMPTPSTYPLPPPPSFDRSETSVGRAYFSEDRPQPPPMFATPQQEPLPDQTLVFDERANSVAPSLPAEIDMDVGLPRAQEFRSAIKKATTVEECRVLVDVFLAHWGLGGVLNDDALAELTPVIAPTAAPVEGDQNTHHSDSSLIYVDAHLNQASGDKGHNYIDVQENSLVELLLGEGDVVTTRTTEVSQPVGDETVDRETPVEAKLSRPSDYMRIAPPPSTRNFGELPPTPARSDILSPIHADDWHSIVDDEVGHLTPIEDDEAITPVSQTAIHGVSPAPLSSDILTT